MSLFKFLVAKEFTGEGEVDGPGTGTSDSIPAMLSDGEFVFTAKAVKQIGVDRLRKQMKQQKKSMITVWQFKILKWNLDNP